MQNEEQTIQVNNGNSGVVKGIGIGILIMLILVGAYIAYNTITTNITSQEKIVKDLNSDLNLCKTSYVHDLNITLYNGSTMKQHLAICRTTLQCVLDFNSCSIKNSVQEYTNVCLTNDNNILSLYDIFR